MGAGRPTKYNDEVLAKTKDYLVNYENYNDVVPSVVGLAKVLGITSETIYQWAKQEDKADFSDTLGKINDYQHHGLLNGGLRNELNPTITKLMLANHGYSERQQQEISGPGGGPVEHDHYWQIEIVDASNADTSET